MTTLKLKLLRRFAEWDNCMLFLEILSITGTIVVSANTAFDGETLL